MITIYVTILAWWCLRTICLSEGVVLFLVSTFSALRDLDTTAWSFSSLKLYGAHDLDKTLELLCPRSRVYLTHVVAGVHGAGANYHSTCSTMFFTPTLASKKKITLIKFEQEIWPDCLHASCEKTFDIEVHKDDCDQFQYLLLLYFNPVHVPAISSQQNSWYSLVYKIERYKIILIPTLFVTVTFQYIFTRYKFYFIFFFSTDCNTLRKIM